MYTIRFWNSEIEMTKTFHPEAESEPNGIRKTPHCWTKTEALGIKILWGGVRLNELSHPELILQVLNEV